MQASIANITELLSVQGHQQYGLEAVSQLEHALQCATLAEAADASPEMITACLLHDLGHLLNSEKAVAEHDIDDCHEYRALGFLKTLFPPPVTEPIRLHVAAKRYLCAVDASYHDNLSPASQLSLQLQGGIFSELAAAEFIEQPYAPEALQLRIWDDQAKVATLSTPDLAHFLPALIACQ